MSAGNDPDFDAILGGSPTEGLEAAADASLEEGAQPATEEKVEETPATPAQPERPRGPKKVWWDIYTSMLAITLLAIIAGCVFLVMEWSRYNFETTPPAISITGGGEGG
jgi:hypothetical protein